MKKLILAGIVIIICCLVFLIVRQNASRADIAQDIYDKPYVISFGEWLDVYLHATIQQNNAPAWGITVQRIEGELRFKVTFIYNVSTENGNKFYQEYWPKVKDLIRLKCIIWTQQGYPISFNDFEFESQQVMSWW